MKFEDRVWSWSLKFEVEDWSWSLQLKFKVEVWSWSLKLKFEVKVCSWSLEFRVGASSLQMTLWIDRSYQGLLCLFSYSILQNKIKSPNKVASAISELHLYFFRCTNHELSSLHLQKCRKRKNDDFSILIILIKNVFF